MEGRGGRQKTEIRRQQTEDRRQTGRNLEPEAGSQRVESRRERFFWKLYGWCSDSIYHLMPYRKLLWDTYQALDLKPGMKILDAGCGTGNFEKFTSEKDPPKIRIEALEPSTWRLQRAKRKCKNLNYVSLSQGNLDERLNYSDNTFDRIVSLNLLPALKNPHFTLKEFRRVLKPQGKLVLATPKSDAIPSQTSILIRNHLRRIRNIWGIHRKFFTLLETPAWLFSQKLASSLLHIFVLEKDKKNEEFHLLPGRNFVRLLAQNGFQEVELVLTSAGQNWLVSGFKNSSKTSSPIKLMSQTKNKRKSVNAQKVIVREAKSEDVPEIYVVELAAWGEKGAATPNQLKSRIEAFPAGNLVAVADDKIVGYTSFILIDYNLFSLNGNNTWYKATDDGYAATHNFKGKDLFGVNLSVRNGVPHRKISMPLLAEVIKRGVQAGVRSYILGSRIPLYYKYADRMDVEEYTRAETSLGKPIDPELRFYIAVGMNIVDVVAEYYEDPRSLNYGIIMKKDNPFHKNPVLNFLAKGLAHLPYDFAGLVSRVRH